MRYNARYRITPPFGSLQLTVDSVQLWYFSALPKNGFEWQVLIFACHFKSVRKADTTFRQFTVDSVQLWYRLQIFTCHFKSVFAKGENTTTVNCTLCTVH